MDRRLIRERISRLKKELKDVEKHRELIRTQRKQSGLKVAALVGYTSAGKSSIENALTNAGILERRHAVFYIRYYNPLSCSR